MLEARGYKLHVVMREGDDEEEGITHVRGTISGSDDDSIGHLKGYLIDLEVVGEEFYALMDELSAELQEFAVGLLERDGSLQSKHYGDVFGPEIDGCGRLFYLDEMVLHKAHRGKGVAAPLLGALLRKLDYEVAFARLAAVTACCRDYEDFPERDPYADKAQIVPPRAQRLANNVR